MKQSSGNNGPNAV